MRKIFQELYATTRLLVPKGRYRWQLLFLVLIAASIPVTELLVAKLFTDLVVSGSSRPMVEIVISASLFALLFAGTRAANYGQKTYRVKFFDKAFANEARGSGDEIMHKGSW